MLLNYHIGRFVLGSLCVGDLVRLRFEWCPCCRLKLQLGHRMTEESSLNLCTGRPPTGVMIPDAV